MEGRGVWDAVWVQKGDQGRGLSAEFRAAPCPPQSQVAQNGWLLPVTLLWALGGGGGFTLPPIPQRGLSAPIGWKLASGSGEILLGCRGSVHSLPLLLWYPEP